MQVRGKVYCLAADAYFLMNPLRIYLLVTLCFFFPRDILPGRHGSFFVRFFSTLDVRSDGRQAYAF